MITPEKTTQKEYKVVPEGTHIARCYQIIHYGNVPNTHPLATFPTVNKIRLSWEFPEEMDTFTPGSEPQPYSIHAEYTLSMSDKSNLKKVVEGWLGKKLTEAELVNFDAESLVGQTCMITVVHTVKNERTYANVVSISKLPKSSVCPPQVNKPTIINWDNLDLDTFNKLPLFIQDKMKSSLEYKRWIAKAKTTGIPYPQEEIDVLDIPF